MCVLDSSLCVRVRAGLFEVGCGLVLRLVDVCVSVCERVGVRWFGYFGLLCFASLFRFGLRCVLRLCVSVWCVPFFCLMGVMWRVLVCVVRVAVLCSRACGYGLLCCV